MHGQGTVLLAAGLDFKICFRSEKLPGLSRNRPLAFKKLCHHYNRLELQQKRFLKIHFGLQISF